MNVPHQMGTAQVQFVVALVDEDAFGIEHRSERSVEQDEGGGIDEAGAARVARVARVEG